MTRRERFQMLKRRKDRERQRDADLRIARHVYSLRVTKAILDSRAADLGL